MIAGAPSTGGGAGPGSADIATSRSRSVSGVTRCHGRATHRAARPYRAPNRRPMRAACRRGRLAPMSALSDLLAARTAADRCPGRPHPAAGRGVAAALRPLLRRPAAVGAGRGGRRRGRQRRRLPLRGPVPPDDRADRLPERPGRGGAARRPGRAAARRLHRGPDLPRGRAGLGRRPADPPRGDPGARRRATVIAVLGRDANLASARTPSQLELVYLQSAADLAAMVADGTFPGPAARARGGLRSARRATGWCGSSRTARSSTPARTRCPRSAGSGVTGNVLGEPIDALTSTVADDPFDAGDLAAAVGTRDRGRPAGQHRGRRRGSDRPVPSAAAAAARARRSARCCSCRTSPSCAAGTARS